jgi:hypothetical protein
MGEIDDKIINAIKQVVLRSRFTSQSFGKENETLEAGDPDSIGLDDIIQGGDTTDPNKISEQQDTQDTIDTVKSWKESNLGEINKFGSEQMGNLRSMTTDPVGFFITRFFGRFARGAGVIALATLIFEAVKFIIGQLFAEGRPFDIRFRERIDRQVILFLERKEQAELRQTHKQVITTTIGGLRGPTLSGQIGGNFYNPDRIPANFLDTRRISEDNPAAQDTSNIRAGLFGKRGRRSS